MKKAAAVLFISSLSLVCITSHSEGFVNYKAVGDVYRTKSEAVEHQKVGTTR